MESLIGQDNKFHKQAHLNVLTRMEKRAPKTNTERTLIDLILWYTQKVEAPLLAYTLGLLLKGGWLRFKDFGFKRADLRRFHSYGQVSDHMMQMLEQVPQKARQIFNRHEERKYRLERSEYMRLQRSVAA